MRKTQKLLSTEELFLDLVDRGLAEPRRLMARVSKMDRPGSQWGRQGKMLEARLYLVYESAIFPEDPVGAAEIMTLQFPDLHIDKGQRVLDHALHQVRVSMSSQEDVPAPLSRDVLEQAELAAFSSLLRFPAKCITRHEGVQAVAARSGLLSFDIPVTPALEASPVRASSATGLSEDDVERLVASALARQAESGYLADGCSPS